MRVWSRIPLVVALICAAIGFGVPLRGTPLSGVHAQRAPKAAPAGVAQSSASPTVFAVVVAVTPNPTIYNLLTSVTVATLPQVSCTLSIRLPDQSIQQNVATGTTDSGGNLTLQFTPSYAMVGQDQATVICSAIQIGQPQATGAGTAIFSVLPPTSTPSPTPVETAPGAEQVSITPNTALVPGSIFSIIGEGFPPGATITFAGFPLSGTYSGVAQANGALLIPNIMVPYIQPSGTIISRLRDSANPLDTTTVSITIKPLAPAVTLNTASAAHGDTVAISGSGFGGNEVVDVSLGATTLLTIKADNLGSFSGTFIVPGDAPLGPFTIAARGESTAALAIVPLTIAAVSPFAPSATPTATATPIPPSPTPGPPTNTPTATPIPVGPTRASFYFPEGTTAGGEQVTYSVLNTATTPANVTLKLVFADGRVIGDAFLAPAQSLSQVSANGLIGLLEQGQPFSAQLNADQPVTASRSITRPGQDGTLSDGTQRNYHYQYFAEGYTGRGFRETLALFNSQNANASVQVRLLPSDGAPPIIRNYIVGPLRRYTVDVNALAPRLSVGAIVISDVELSVERTLTFGANGHGQTTVAGVDAPQTTWYFAEGSTSNGFSEFITLLNPTLEPASVAADFFDPAGRRLARRTLVVAAHARATIDVGKLARASSVGAIITSSVPVVAERTMYRGSLIGPDVIGSGSFGRSALASAYQFPYGDTSPGDAEFLLLLNPTDSAITLQLRFYTATGARAPISVLVPAHSRTTLDVARAAPGLPPGPHGVVVSSLGGLPFVAEQSEYLHNFTSASSSIGIAQPAAS